MAAAEPPAKKAKTEEEKPVEETKADEIKAPEEDKELEENATKIKGAKIKASVGFLAHETTLNIAETMFGNMLTCVSDGGLQYFLGGARANVGVKSGRYMFEMNVVELMHQTQPAAGTVTGEDAESICFDAVGDLIHNKKKTPVGAKFERSMTVGCVLNLDSASPNANTISLFRDGVRICKPQALPEALVGKTLYPTTTFRNVTVHYNFGPVARAPLPFTCHMLQDAGDKDVEVTPEMGAGKDGKYTAVFPVAMPDEGGFQWLDDWLSNNPGFTELSDRAILNWAQKSGIARLKPYAARSSNDKPEMNFGLPNLDDKSVQKLLLSLAPMQNRNFVVVEMQKMLLAEDRKALISSFGDFKKVAMMAIGEPSTAFKAKSQELMLKSKQEASDAAFRKKQQMEKAQKVEAKKKKEAEKKKKAEDKAKAKQVAERKKQLQEMVKKKEEEKKKKEEEEKIAKGEAVEEKKEEESAKEEPKEEETEVKEETKEEEEKEEEEEEEAEEMEVDQPDPEPPSVELTAEEKKMWYPPKQIPDIAPFDVNKNFSKYTLPEKSDGFDEVKYEWQPAPKCIEYLTKWRLNKKVTARVEDIVVGDWFTTSQEGWSKFLTSLKTKQNEYKAALAKKAAEKANKEKVKKMKAAMKVAAAKKAEEEKKAKAAAAEKKAKEEEEKKAKAAEEKKEGEDEAMEDAKEEAEEAKPMEEDEAKAEEEEEKEEEEAEEEEVEEPDVDPMSIEVFDVEDICDIGGNPKKNLFTDFQFEDWSLMSLRFELSLLVHAFKKDVKDPERTGIHLDNIGFYYQRYFRKALAPQTFGLKTLKELIGLVSDTIAISDKNILHTCMPESLEALNMYVLLTEEARRDRQRRIDLGEEAAQIKMQSGTLLNQAGGAQPASVAALIQMQKDKLAQAGGNATGAPTTVRPTTPATVAPVAFGVRPQFGAVRPAAGFGPQAGGWRPQAAPQPWAQQARPTAPSWAAAAQRPAFNAAGTIRPAWRG